MLIITSIKSIMRGENPRVMTEILSSYVTPEHRAKLDEQQEA